MFHGLWPTQRQRVITIIYLVLFKQQSLFLLFSLLLCLFLGLCLE